MRSGIVARSRSDQPVGEHRAVGEGDPAFLRTTEFPGRKGTRRTRPDEAEAETLMILDLYADTSERVLAMPVIKG